MSRPARAAFLDRDGVLTEEVGFVTRVEELRVVPGAFEAVRALRELGHRIVVVTNQSAVARGLLTEEGLAAIHADLERRFRVAGAPLDGIYACPHHPEAERVAYRAACSCRKPSPGLLLRAAEELGLRLDRGSVLVGDQARDLAAGRTAGVRCVLVRTGKGTASEAQVRAEFPDAVVCDSIRDVPDLVRT
jgi:D-glycero-D-manno-heptose 1,7-bisphosphate phosphatase